MKKNIDREENNMVTVFMNLFNTVMPFKWKLY